MNKSTLKKIAALSLVATMGSLTLFAQEEPTTDDAVMQSDASAPKMFEGRKQFRTWSIGLNAGALQPSTIFGGYNDQSSSNMELGYGAYLKKQLAPSFSLQIDFLKGTLSSDAEPSDDNGTGIQYGDAFSTDLLWQTGLSGNVNVGTIDFLRRKNSVDFFVTAGYNIASYEVTEGASVDGETRTEQSIPVGAGIKFKLGEVVNLDLGYKMYFLDADNLDNDYGTNPHALDKYSYLYGGLEFVLGNKQKPALEWANPIALMYDELYDETLRQEVEALKGRVSSVEDDLNTLKADADGDGVSDYFDKEASSPAGARVDGSGRAMDIDGDGVLDHEDKCPTVAGPADNQGCPVEAVEANASSIQFDFDSAKIRPESYSALDQLASELSSGSSSAVLEGHASAEGTEAYNQRLSERRANSVKKYLVNAGVSSSGLSTAGFGESRPVASNDTEAGRMKNRRVEIKIQ